MTGPCADCFKGSIHTGTPTGVVADVHGLQTYIASPEAGVTPKGLVIMITDAFGFEFVNNRILCDEYAKKGGFLVYCPDFMDGKAMSSKCLPLMEKLTAPASVLSSIIYKPIYAVQALYHAIPWLIATRPSICRPRIVKFFTALRTAPPPYETSSLKIGVCGFCWGGQHVFFLANDKPYTRVKGHCSQTSGAITNPASPSTTATTGTPASPNKTADEDSIPLIDCAFTAHPSMVKVPKDIEGVTLPVSVAVGETDMAMKAPQIQQMKEILEVKKKGDNEVVIMPGAKHGFAVRAVPDDGVQRKWADKAETQALEWFAKYLA